MAAQKRLPADSADSLFISLCSISTVKPYNEVVLDAADEDKLEKTIFYERKPARS